MEKLNFEKGVLYIKGRENGSQATVLNDQSKYIKLLEGDTDKVKEIVIEGNVKRCNASYFSFFKNLKKVTINEGFKELATASFYGCKKLEEISLCDSINYIGEDCFTSCTSLKSIKLPKELKVLNSGVFYNCTSLKEVTLNEGLEKIEDTAFENCTSIREIILPSSLVSIDRSAFRNCTSLNRFVLNDNLKVIPVLHDDMSETNINELVAGVNNLYYKNDENGLLYSKDGKELYFCPRNKKSVYVKEGCEVIKENAFSYCTKLQNVFLPSTLKELNYFSFRNCISLKKIDLPENLSKIDDGAFYNCSNLKKVNIKENVSFISSTSFNSVRKVDINISKDNPYYFIEEGIIYKRNSVDNPSLQDSFTLVCSVSTNEEIIVKDGCTKISKSAFLRNPKVRKIILSKDVKEIENYAFTYCDSLEEIVFNSPDTKFTDRALYMDNSKKVKIVNNWKKDN